MGPLSKSKKTIADIPDFKRRKAKVGKRAPKPANVTETTFQSASINVKNQSSAVARVIPNTELQLSSSLLFSSRGKSIYELSIQLHHPAAAARISAAKGLRDIINGGTLCDKQEHGQLILRNFSVLVTTCSKCWIDEEKEVREIGGISSLREIIINLQQLANSLTETSSLSFTSSPSTFVAKQLKPLSALLVAYVTAALNSLDPRIRVTGSHVVNILAVNVPDIVASHVDVLIPPFLRLLSERSGSKTFQGLTNHSSTPIDSASLNLGSMKKSDRNKRKRKRNANPISDSGTPVMEKKPVRIVTDATLASNLQAVAALLSSLPSRDGFTELSKTLGEDLTVKPSDAVFVPVAKICNAVMYYRKPSFHCENPVIRTIHDLSSLPMIGERTNRKHPKVLQFGAKATYDLLSRIREVLIEVSQSAVACTNGLMIQDTNDIILISPAIKILRLFLQSFWSDIALMLPKDAEEFTNVASKDQNRMKKLIQNLARVVTGCFLICSDIEDTNCLRDVQEANANICVSLQCLSSLTVACKGFDETRKELLEVAASFVQQTLENDEKLFVDDECDNQVDRSIKYDENRDKDKIKFSTSKSLLEVFGYLVIPNSSKKFLQLGKENENQRSMIDAFCAVFFYDDRKLNDRMACSTISRYAVQIAISIYRTCDYLFETVEELFGTAVLDVPLIIVNYISHWKDSFSNESSICISFLEKLLLQNKLPTTNEGASDAPMALRRNYKLVESFRSGIEKYFADESDSPATPPIPVRTTCCFERLSPVLQRQVVCFVVLLKYPTDMTLAGLGRVCSRHRLFQAKLEEQKSETGSIQRIIDESEASFIVQVIHSIRKTITIQKYLGFLMDSTGLMHMDFVPILKKCNDFASSDDFISNIDNGTSIVCSCLMDCGIDLVLPKLEPLFTAFLQRFVDVSGRDGYAMEKELICSRAVVAITSMLSLGLSDSDNQSRTLRHGWVSEGFSSNLVASIIGIMMHVSRMTKGNNDSISKCKLLKPIQAFVNIDKHVSFEIFQSLVSKLDETECVNNKATILDVLHMILHENEFRKTLYWKLDEIHLQMQSISLLHQKGPFEDFTNKILATIEIAMKLK